MTEPAQAEATYTIEWATSTLAEGVDEAALLTASQVLQRDFFSKQPGFLHRELLKRSANQWVDIIHWKAATRPSRRCAMPKLAQSATATSH
jgi:hypothetical protein